MAKRHLTSPIVPEPTASSHAASKDYADKRIVRQASPPSDTTALWIDTDDDGAAAIPVTIFDAKGDLIVGTADNGYQRLPVGADGSEFVADPSQDGGVGWREPKPCGSVQLASHATNHNAIGNYWNISQFTPSWSTPHYVDGITWDAANSRFTVIRSGMYRAQAYVSTNSFGGSAGMLAVRVTKNGGVTSCPHHAGHKGGVSELLTVPSGSDPLIPCIAGDHLSFQVYWTWGGGAGAITLVTGVWTRFAVEWVRP